MAMEGNVHFIRWEEAHGPAERAFERHRARLSALLPTADIQHIGGTAVPGALTKGDLDIQVRVTAAQFAEAERVLAGLYERNTGSIRTDSFSSFKDDAEDPQLGIQLTEIGSQFDDFTTLRDRLASDPESLRRYNELKLACEGMDMDAYRRRKGELVESIVAAAHADRARQQGGDRER